jgi:hypothetical protein
MGASTRNRAIMSDPTSAQMPSEIDGGARHESDTGRPAADPRKRESGGTSVACHPFVLPDVRDPGSDEEHREEHAPVQDDDPFGRGQNPSLANARPWHWSKLKPSRKKTQAIHEEGTHRGGSPSSCQPRSWIARASRSHDRPVDQTLAGTPS